MTDRAAQGKIDAAADATYAAAKAKFGGGVLPDVLSDESESSAGWYRRS